MTRKQTSLVFIHPSDEIYGADRMLLEQIAAVPESVDVEVWLPNDLSHPQFPLCELLTARDIRVRHLELPILRRSYRTPRGVLGLLRRGFALYRQLRRNAPDVVYCTTSAASLGAAVARAARVRRIYGHVQEIWNGADRVVLGLIFSACHRILCVSRAAAAAMPTRLHARAIVVPNSAQHPPSAVALDERSGPLTFVVASRWTPGKGYATLLTAWNKVHDGRLVVLGGPPLSGESVDLVAMIATLDRPASVELVGEVDDPTPYLLDADLVLVPSDYPEGFGLVVIEGFACGRPAVASRAGGLLDIVTDGRDGWLFPPGDSDALANVLSGLTRDAVNAAGRAARQTFDERYTPEQYQARWRTATRLVAARDA